MQQPETVESVQGLQLVVRHRRSTRVLDKRCTQKDFEGHCDGLSPMAGSTLIAANISSLTDDNSPPPVKRQRTNGNNASTSIENESEPEFDWDLQQVTYEAHFSDDVFDAAASVSLCGTIGSWTVDEMEPSSVHQDGPTLQGEVFPVNQD